MEICIDTCLMNIGHIWRILILFSFPNYSRRLVRQQYQLSSPPLKSPNQKRRTFLKLSVSSSELVAGVNWKREKEELEEYPPIPCIDEEMNTIIDKWMADGVLKPFKPNWEPTLEDKKKPFFC